MSMDFKIIPLEKKYLEAAIALAHSIFFQEAKEEDNPGLAFTISLDPSNPKYKEFWERDNSDWFEYYIALDTNTKKVIGTSGLYHHKDEPDTIVYLGWYCVSPEYQGKGIGKALLQFTIDTAKKTGKTVLRLYTNEQENKTAQIVYEKFGFRPFKQEKRNKQLLTYKEMIL